jgi:hemolysin III
MSEPASKSVGELVGESVGELMTRSRRLSRRLTDKRGLRWVVPNQPDRLRRDILPKWRGRLHQASLVVTIPAGILLIRSASTTRGAIAAGIYVATLIGLFTSSSLYNRMLGTERLREWMRWLDHAMIYVLIAGSYTPTCLVTLPRNIGIPMLIVVWGGAIIGVLTKFLLRQKFRVPGTVLYFITGGAVLVAIPQMFGALAPLQLALYGAGLVLYVVGGIHLYLRRPDPNPAVFGYHEVWHIYVVLACICHFAANWWSVAQPPLM